MSFDPELHELAAAYVLNALDHEDRERFEAYLLTSERTKAEVSQLRETVAGMADEVAVTPPRSLRPQVLAEAARTPQLEPELIEPVRRDRRRPGRRMALAAAASLLVAAGLAVTFRPDSDTPAEVEVAQIESADDVIVTQLVPAEGVAGLVTVGWSPSLGAVSIEADGVIDPGPGEVYELWFVLSDGVAMAGLFSPTDGGFSGVIPVDRPDVVGWGVTIEPEGGSEQPTGPILHLAEL